MAHSGPKSRWLWPSSHSSFLRNPLYSFETIAYNESKAYSGDVLLPGSDDELDAEERHTKRQRIDHLARGYLMGRGLLIPSASLQGPFGLPNDENYPPSDAGLLSEVEDVEQGGVKDRYIELPAKPAARSPQIVTVGMAMEEDPHISPVPRKGGGDKGVPSSNFPAALRTPPSSPPPAVGDLIAVAELEDEAGENDSDESEDGLNMNTGIEQAKQLSQAAIEAYQNDLEGIEAAKRLSQAAMEQNGDSHTLSAQSERSKEFVERSVTFLSEEHINHASGSNFATSRNVKDASSPFLFRYKKANGKRKRKPTPVATKVAEPASDVQQLVAAATLQDIYDVTMEADVDLIDRHTNRRLGGAGPNDARSRSLKGKLRKSMQDSGATFEYDEAAPPTPDRVSILQDHPTESSPRVGGANEKDATGAQEPAMQMSTQTALQEAHRDLLKSSPNANFLSPIQSSRRPISADISQSPAPVITPFANFHERFDAQPDDTQYPQISTQAMFDAFSPFQISPVKRIEAGEQLQAPPKSPVFPQPSGFTPINKRKEQSSTDAAIEPRSGAKTADQDLEGNGGVPVPDAGWSFAVLDASPTGEPAVATSRNVSPPVQLRPSKGLKSMGFKVTKTSSQSQSKSSQSDQSQSQWKAQGESTMPRKDNNSVKAVPSVRHTSNDLDRTHIAKDIAQQSADVPQEKHMAPAEANRKQSQPIPTNVASAAPSSIKTKKSKSRRRKSFPGNGTQMSTSQPLGSLSQPAVTKSALHKSDINRSFTPSRPQSFALSDILASFTSSHPHVDVGGVLSQASVNSRNSGRHSLPAQKRGSVMDWDAESDAGDFVTDQQRNVEEGPIPSNISRITDSMSVTNGRPPISSAGSFTVPSIPASRVRMSLGSQSPRKNGLSIVAEGSFATTKSSGKGGLKSSLKKRSKESIQDAQKEDTMVNLSTDFDIDTSLNELTNDVLGGWDVEEEARAL